jgi:predicted ATPase
VQIETIEIRNYRLFRSAVLEDLPRLTVVVGANGSGKSTLFDVFSFLKEALIQNVAQAVARRGGFGELASRGERGPIGFTVKFRESGGRLYPELFHELVEEFRDYARRGGQVLVSTHSPDCLNGAHLDEIYWLVKQDGFTTARRAGANDLLRALVREGDLPGALWKQGLFEGAGLR